MVMANQQDQEGIKLFGKTITLHSRQSKENQDHHHHQQHHQIITTSTKEKNSNPSSVDKRPDKIIPCPRCKSMETKFCYFNNYNVNQPRHFCKGCQRYWTAGGALRNVPVGAGRRKNKPPGRGGAGAGAGFQDGCLYDVPSGAPNQFDLDGMVLEEWQVAAHGGFQHVFPLKRRRSCSDDPIVVSYLEHDHDTSDDDKAACGDPIFSRLMRGKYEQTQILSQSEGMVWEMAAKRFFISRI